MRDFNEPYMRSYKEFMKDLKRILSLAIMLGLLSMSGLAVEPQKKDEQKPPEKEVKHPEKKEKDPPPPPKDDNKGGQEGKKGKP